ncbi:histidine phosphatase family protein [Candidatus Woesebacteria bacterium]|nr:MAG: histidine phosphatase family protein [Candidatus Woesebacteria bacterium]
MAKILVARHAESIANTKGIYQGQTYNTGLSPLGKKQAKALAESLTRDIDQIISSPLKRTMETARIVSQKIGVEVVYEHAIIETNHGEWEGKNIKWIKNNYPEVFDLWQNMPSKAVFPFGEKFVETAGRVRNYIMGKTWQGNSLLITHDNIVRVMVCMAEKRPIDDLWKFKLDPAAVTEFDIVGVNGSKELKLVKLNDTEHLTKLRSDLSSHAL